MYDKIVELLNYHTSLEATPASPLVPATPAQMDRLKVLKQEITQLRAIFEATL